MLRYIEKEGTEVPPFKCLWLQREGLTRGATARTHFALDLHDSSPEVHPCPSHVDLTSPMLIARDGASSSLLTVVNIDAVLSDDDAQSEPLLHVTQETRQP